MTSACFYHMPVLWLDGSWQATGDQRVAFIKCTNDFIVSVQRDLSFSLSTLFENLTSFQVFFWLDPMLYEENVALCEVHYLKHG